MSSYDPDQHSKSNEAEGNDSKQLCGFLLAELIKAMPPVMPASSTGISKPEHLDQYSIDRLMSPDLEQPISLFIDNEPR